MGKQTHRLIVDDSVTIEPLSNALGHAVASRQRGTMAREKAAHLEGKLSTMGRPWWKAITEGLTRIPMEAARWNVGRTARS